MKGFGNAVKLVRNMRGITQRELAKRSGLSPSYVAAIELDKRDLTWKSIQKLCVGLKVNPALLIFLAQNDPSLAMFTPMVMAKIWEE